MKTLSEAIETVPLPMAPPELFGIACLGKWVGTDTRPFVYSSQQFARSEAEMIPALKGKPWSIERIGIKPPESQAPEMHRYLEMLRSMLLNRFEADVIKVRLQGPRVRVLIGLVSDATGLRGEELAKKLGTDFGYFNQLVNTETADASERFLESLYMLWEPTQTKQQMPQSWRMETNWPEGR